MIRFKELCVQLMIAPVLILFASEALAGAAVKMICPCSFEQIDQTAASVELSLGFIEDVESSGSLRVEVVHFNAKDLFSADGYYSLGETNLGSYDFRAEAIPVAATIPLRARELDEGRLALLLWSDQSDVPIDQVLLGPRSVAISTLYGIRPFDSPSVVFTAGLDFEFGLGGAQLSIGDILSPDLAGTEEIWSLKIVVVDNEGYYFEKAAFEATVSFDADGRASLTSNIELSDNLDSHLSGYADFTEVELWIYRNDEFYLRYWLGSLSGQSGPSLIALIEAVDAVSDSDGDGLTDYVESLIGSSPDLFDWFGLAEIEVAFTYGSTAVDAYGSDLGARVAHVIEVANLAFETSDVPARVVMTDLIELGDDSGLTAATLIPLMGARESLFSELDNRFSRKPDLIVHLGMVDVIDTGGLANLQGGLNDGVFDGANYAATGSNVGVVGLDNSDTTLVHEVGHLMGLDHSRVQGTAEGAFPWSLGHGVDASFVTIMAYPTAFSDAPEVANFSTPNLQCGALSELCGVDRSDLVRGADAARSLAITAFQVAATSNGFTPVVHLSGGAEVIVANAEAITELVFQITDAEDGDLTAAAEVALAGSSEEGIDYVQTIRVTDSDGNSVEVVRRIKVDASLASGGETSGASTDGGTTSGESGGETSGGETTGGESTGGETDDGGALDAGLSDGGAASAGEDDSGAGVSGGVNFDVDASGEITALTDGLLIIRHLFGFEGAALTNGAVSSAATRTSADQIRTTIESRRLDYDVDGDDETRALTDGLLIIRYLFGFEGDALTSGATGAGSTLSTAEILLNLKALDQPDQSGGDGSTDGELSSGGETTGAETTGGETTGGETTGGETTGGESDGGSSDSGGTDGGAGSLDSDGDGLLDQVDPQPEIDNSSDLARYQWVNDRKTWLEAKQYAEDQGGYLASITTEFEDQLLYALVSSQFDANAYETWGYAGDGGSAVYVWLGASDLDSEGDFVWESGEAFEYSNWGSVEPDDFGTGQDALALAMEDWPIGSEELLGQAGQWNDIDHAANALTFIIEFPDGATDTGAGSGGDTGSTDGVGDTGGSTGGGASDGGTTSGETSGGGTDSGETTGGSTDTGGSSDGGTSSGSTDGGSTSGGDSDGGGTGFVDVEIDVLYERVLPVCESALSCALDYDNSLLKPVRYANVLVYDASTDEKLPNAESLSTDSDGKVRVSVEEGQSFYVIVAAQSVREGDDAAWELEIKNNSGSSTLEPTGAGYPVYAVKSDTWTATGTSLALSMALKSGWSGSSYGEQRTSAPFAILDSVIDAMLALTSASAPLTFPALDIYWSKDNKPDDSSIGTSYYQDGVIRILGDENVDTDEFDQHVVIHEWGHYFQDKLSRDDSIGGSHSGAELLDPRVSYSEGWANALSGLIIGDTEYKDTSGSKQGSGFTVSLESAGPFIATEGWYSEESVGRIVFDLFDQADDSEDFDTISLTLETMVQVMTMKIPEQESFTTIYNFVAGVIAVQQDLAADVLRLLGGQNIASGLDAVDIYGAGETNDGSAYKNESNESSSNGLPIYTALAVGAEAVTVCQDQVHGTYNKLGNRRFLRFNANTSGTYTISVTSTFTGAEYSSSDPDFYVWNRSGYVGKAESSEVGSETTTLSLSAGAHWLELYDYNLVSGSSTPAPCQEIQVVKQ